MLENLFPPSARPTLWEIWGKFLAESNFQTHSSGCMGIREIGKGIYYYFVSDSNKLLAVATVVNALEFF